MSENKQEFKGNDKIRYYDYSHHSFRVGVVIDQFPDSVLEIPPNMIWVQFEDEPAPELIDTEKTTLEIIKKTEPIKTEDLPDLPCLHPSNQVVTSYTGLGPDKKTFFVCRNCKNEVIKTACGNYQDINSKKMYERRGVSQPDKNTKIARFPNVDLDDFDIFMGTKS